MLHILEVKSAVYFSGVPQTTNLTWGRSKKDGVKKDVMRDGWGGELTRIDQSAGETAWAAEEVKPTHTHTLKPKRLLPIFMATQWLFGW